ncbi:MAG: beta-aspartyl-peptidase, partial [Bacteroidetes bacterium]|nr:beta-aspartyl-peptidase [Bacteroidota bacterium]
MIRLKFSVIIILCSLFTFSQTVKNDASFAIVIHGGAGTILKKDMSDELEKKYKDKLEEALKTGYDTLSRGGSSTDAVVLAIKVLEDSPLFNA